ncbi:MAG TPA: hypothetical protein VLM11_08270 [Streptosporangiaceae bacterium]|nr:hypothetical protein [Streptosporangiaceae bacterium]
MIDKAAKARVLADLALEGHIFVTPDFTFGADFFDAVGVTGVGSRSTGFAVAFA